MLFLSSEKRRKEPLVSEENKPVLQPNPERVSNKESQDTEEMVHIPDYVMLDFGFLEDTCANTEKAR